MQQFSWLTRFPSSSRQRKAAFPNLVVPGQPGFFYQQLPAQSIIQQQFSWLTRVPNSSKQRQASFPSLVFLANQDYPSAATNQRQHCAAAFLANQVSQQQQARKSGIPQPSFSWPTRIFLQQLPAQSSIQQQFSGLTRVPNSSKQRQASFPSLVFLANKNYPSAATNQRQHCAAVFLANQVSQQQQATKSGIPQPSFSWPTSIFLQQLPAESSIQQQFSGLTRVPNSSNQRQASFPSLVFLVNQDYPSAATNQRLHCAAVFLAN